MAAAEQRLPICDWTPAWGGGSANPSTSVSLGKTSSLPRMLNITTRSRCSIRLPNAASLERLLSDFESALDMLSGPKLILILAAGFIISAPAQTVDEYQVKSAFVFNFA